MSYACTQSDLEDKYGVRNIATWSAMNGSQNADTARIARAIAYAADKINSTFRGRGFAVPLTGYSDTSMVTDWVATLAVEWLYNTRGMRDDDTDGNYIGNDAKRVRAEMQAMIQFPERFNAQRAWPQPTAPVGL